MLIRFHLEFGARRSPLAPVKHASYRTTMPTTCLYDANSHRDHAYTNDGKNYYLSRDNSWWAYQSENHLYDAKTNREIVYWSGDYLYDAKTNKPLWYRT